MNTFAAADEHPAVLKIVNQLTFRISHQDTCLTKIFTLHLNILLSGSPGEAYQ